MLTKMAARIMLFDFVFVALFTLVISSPLDGHDDHLRIRRQFGTPDSSLQQTVQGIQNNRRPGQSGNNQGQSNGGFTSGSVNGQGSGNTQGQSTGGFNTGGFNTGSSQNGGGFNSGSEQGQGIGNNQGQNGGQNGGSFSSGSGQGQGVGNNQGQSGGGFSSGSNNGQGQGLNQPTTVPNPYVTIVNSEYQLSNELVQCIRRCPSTSQFNPICGSDNVTYTNESRMKCAQKCGRRVTEVYRGTCVPSATTTPAVPISG